MNFLLHIIGDIILVLDCLLFVLIILMLVLIKLHNTIRWRQTRKAMANLYGDTINRCVLCPTCEGFVYIGVWKRHLEYGHAQIHYIEPLPKLFEEAIVNLDK